MAACADEGRDKGEGAMVVATGDQSEAVENAFDQEASLPSLLGQEVS